MIITFAFYFMIHTEIITIGDELLIGQVIDTNSAWIGQQLNDIGIKVSQITSISDDESHILTTLKEASSRADVILITGGLGPTKDDITKRTLCKYFNSGLRFDKDSFEIIQNIFKSRGREVTELNRLQAQVPDNCSVLLNRLGTAPGMWFEHEGKIYVSMPGVPNEMKGLMNSHVIPALKKKFSLPAIIHKTILTQGIAESFLAEKISDWEDNLPPFIKLAYLPAAGMVRLRLTASGLDESKMRNEVENQVKLLQPIISDFIWGYDKDKLEEIVGKLLLEQRKTLSTAESCTGGIIAHRITSVPGSSEYYQGSIVAYANEIKVNQLNVDIEMLESFGAVSEEVVTFMAKNALKRFNSNYAIATSGIAGPGGGTALKPVGTVWLAIASNEKIITRKLQLGQHRERVIMETSHHALNMLRKMLLGQYP
jgi:nicotinamide-nucleotide amidase